MKNLLNAHMLRNENAAHEGTGGVSRCNASMGFRPAFFDYATHRIYPSRFRDGRASPFHVLDGLPDEVIAIRADDGRVLAAKATLISGFERNGYFFTRTAAARAVREWSTGEE
jgi:hypothetical protein